MPSRRSVKSLRPLAHSLSKFSSAAAIVAALVASTSQAQVIWDAGSGTNLLWDTLTNWSLDAKPAALDAVIFPTPIPNPGSLANPSTIILGGGELAQSLSFLDTYRLSGGDLTLGTGGNIGVAARMSATIDSVIGGSGGLTKTGNGRLVLNGLNTFTGTVSINGGGIVAVNSTAFGAAANTISLDGGTLRFYNQTNTTGFGSGHGRMSRFINIGAGGGTIDVPNQNIIAFDTVNTFTGTGVLTKTGLGEFQLVNANNFAGSIVIATSGGRMDVRASGKLSAATSVTVNTGGNFVIENNSAVGPFASVNDNDRVANTTGITLLGGTLTYAARNSTTAGQSAETVGTVTIGQGQSFISASRSGGLGADFTITNLARQSRNIVRFASGSGTLGAAGDNTRIFVTQLNGAAAPVGAPAAAAPAGFLGGWALFGSGEFANNTGGTLGIQASVYTTLTSANFGPTVLGQVAAADITVGTAGTPANFELLSLKLSDAATRQLLFANATDTLYVGQGGVLGSDNNNAKNIGTTALRGQLTAGTVAGGGGRELFLLQNQNTMTVNSAIIDNSAGGAGVSVTKGLDGTVVLAGANSYSGGTNVFRGILTANVAGALGSGAVVVKGNSRLNVNAPGAVTSAAGIEVKDQAEIFLNNGGGSWTTTGDLFTIRSGSALIANQNNTGGIPNANQGINSLTRVSGTPAAGGDVFLEAGAIVAHNSAFNAANGTDANNSTIKNLGTNADLFFGLAATFNAGANQTVTLGAGTPWMGMSTDPRAARAWQQGTIRLNSDITLQGGLSSGTLVSLSLGGNTVAGSYSIVNDAAAPVRIFTANNVVLDEDTAVSISPNITFVVQAQSTLTPNRVNSFGSGGNIAAGVVVQAAGTMDPGQSLGALVAANTPGPLNAPVTLEAGGRLLINDSNGLGSGGLITVQSEGIVEIQGQNNALLGTADSGQFAFQPGSILRLHQDNIYRVSNAVGGGGAILQVFGGNRTLTSQTNPFLTAAVGTTLVAPETISIGTGGGITNDSNSRQVNLGRGRIVLAGNTSLTATTGTTLTVQDSVNLQPGATVNIGAIELNGNPKRGDVRFTGGNSNSGDATTTMNITAGTRLLLGAVNTLPDAGTLNIETGGQLLLDTGNQIEVIGGLTGGGEVRANQTGTQLVVRTNTNQALGAVISSLGSQQPTLTKWGTGNLTVSGAHTSTGDLRIEEGTLTLSGAGQTAFGIVRPGKGATLVLDNSVTALNNRLSGKAISGQGGTVRLIGGATAVTEAVGTLNNGGNPLGSTTFIDVVPGTATTTFTSTGIENFLNTGNRQTTWVFRSPTMANLPGTYNTASVLSANPSNAANGLISVTSPRFTSNGAFDQQANVIAGAVGTPVVATRPDVLGDSSVSGAGVGFVTQDSFAAGFRLLASSEYAPYMRDNQSTSLNVKLAGTNVTSGDTRVQTLTLTPGTSLNINGDLPLNTTPSRLHLNGSGLFVQGGGVASTINGADTYLQFSGTTAAYIHAQGDLNLNARVFSDVGILKTGNGTLNLGAGAGKIWRGTFLMDGGTVNLGPDNSFYVTRATNGFTGQNLALNGGTLNLNGNAQLFNALNSSNPVPGTGGTLTSATPTTVTVMGGGTFSGSIGGAITLDKTGNNTLLLTNVNGYTGNTLVRGNTLQLRDLGALTGTAQVDLTYSTLLLDNSTVANVANRVPTTIPINVRGSSINLVGRPNEVAEQAFSAVNVLGGQITVNSTAGGSGANVIRIDNLTRATAAGNLSPQSMVNFNQNYGFLGAAGDASTAIRDMVSNVNGSPTALTNGIIGGWAIANGDHFATNSTATGISYLSNTADGYANYGGTDLSTAGAATSAINYNDGTAARTIPAASVVNAIRNAPGAAQTITLSGALTIASGGLLTNANQNITYTGGSLTSGADALYAWINQGTTAINSVITGGIDVVKGGGATLALGGANTYTGETVVNAGTLTIGVTGANGDTTVAVPGALIINNATATVTTAGSIKESANVTISGLGRLNLINAAGATETLNSITFENMGGNGGTANVDRTASQPTSVLNLKGATAITANSDNPATIPFFGGSIGQLGFTGTGPQTIVANAPTTTNGLATLGLRIDPLIVSVPTGGLVKSGNGILAINNSNTTAFAGGATTNGSNTITMTSTTGLFVGQHLTGTNIAGNSFITQIIDATTVRISSTPTVTGTGITFAAGQVNPFGNPAAFTDVLNVTQGIVRADQGGALGSNFVNTTVQSGAGLLGAIGAPIFGSVTLKEGSFLGATLNNAAFGAFTASAANQSVMNIAGNTTFYAADYLLDVNAANLTVFSRLTGSGNINLVGPQITQGLGAGGALILSNPIASGAGSNDYTGTITANRNTILQSQQALLPASAASISGNMLGTAPVVLNGGRLRLRDDFSTDNSVQTNQTANYGNNITLLADSFLDVNRASGNAGTVNNTINLGTLTVPSGVQTLTVDSGNGYRAGFASLTGGGTLVKGGNSQLNINGFAGTTTSLAVAGPVGMSVAPASGLVLNAAATVPNFTVNGTHTTNANALTVTGVLEVGSNAGVVTNGTNGISNGAVTGTLAVANTTALNAATLRNNGIIGASGGAATINAAVIQGTGHFQTFGQPLTLVGQIANNGLNATTLRVAGNSTTTLVPTAAGTNTGGTEVLSGTLNIAPTAAATNPLGTGPIRVLGAPADDIIKVAAVTPTLQFTGSITQAGNIENSGVVRVTSGTTTISGTVAGTPISYAPGLREGLVGSTTSLDASATRVTNPGNFGIKLEPRMLQTNVVTGNALTGHIDNELWLYTGEFFDADGVFTFIEDMDDNTMVAIDGVTRLLNNSGTEPWQTVTSTATTAGMRAAQDTTVVNTGTPTLNFGMGPNGDGWHTIEIRMQNGGGGAGPVAANGFTTNFGFGLNPNGTTALNGAVFERPIDPGDGSLFRTKVGGSGNIEVGASGNLGAVALSAAAITRTGLVTLNGGATDVAAAKLSLTGAGVNNADALTLAGGASSFGSVDLVTGSTLTVGTLTVPDGGKLTVNAAGGAGALTVTATHALATTSKVLLEAGTLRFNGTGGAVGAEVQVSSGATANVGGSLTGTVNVSGGTLAGSGTIVGSVNLSAGGTLSPGNSPGVLTVQSLVADASSTFAFEIGAPGAGFGYDQLKVTGDMINLDGATLSLSVTSPVVPNSILNIVLNQGLDLDTGSFGNYVQGQQFTLPGGEQLRISYFDDPATANVLELSGGSSVSLLVVVPEPGSAMLLLGGLGSLVAMRRRRQN